MDKKNANVMALGKGEMAIYDFGEIKLHAYKTNDFIDNEVFIVEKDKSGVIIEAPCFYDNIAELEKYVADSGIAIKGLLLAYHMAGASFMKGVPVFATANADEYGHIGGGAALIGNFTKAFGAAFDNSIFTVTDTIGEGKIEIGGIGFVIKKTADAFDIEIPSINAVYTHMLGHDCHSIVAGANHADAIIAELNEYIAAEIDLVLTSHYTPEDMKDVRTKTAYLEDLKRIAKVSADKADFIDKVKAKYGSYSGLNYLEMTAGFFFA